MEEKNKIIIALNPQLLEAHENGYRQPSLIIE